MLSQRITLCGYCNYFDLKKNDKIWCSLLDTKKKLRLQYSCFCKKKERNVIVKVASLLFNFTFVCQIFYKYPAQAHKHIHIHNIRRNHLVFSGCWEGKHVWNFCNIGEAWGHGRSNRHRCTIIRLYVPFRTIQVN